MRYKLREQTNTIRYRLREDKGLLTPTQLSILEAKLGKVIGIFLPKILRIYNTPEKIKDLFSNTVDKFNSVVSDYKQMIPTTPDEKDLFDVSISGGSGKGNIGPGELFVIITTKNTTFSSGGGDVMSNGQDIEVKKSNVSTIATTYTSGPILEIFPTYEDLIVFANTLTKRLSKYTREDFKKLSPLSRELFTFLNSLTSLRIKIKSNKPMEEMLDELKKYKNILSSGLNKKDLIQSEADEEFLKQIRGTLEFAEDITADKFVEGFPRALKGYFEVKGFQHILLYTGSKGKYKPFLINPTQTGAKLINLDTSIIRNGFTPYIYFNLDQLNEGEKYTVTQKIRSGYGIDRKFFRFIESIIKKIESIVS